jgi:hypothetical protein
MYQNRNAVLIFHMWKFDLCHVEVRPSSFKFGDQVQVHLSAMAGFKPEFFGCLRD